MCFTNLDQLSKPCQRATTDWASARVTFVFRICESATRLRSLVFALPGKRGWCCLMHRIASGFLARYSRVRSFACFLYRPRLERTGSGLGARVLIYATVGRFAGSLGVTQALHRKSVLRLQPKQFMQL